MNNYYWPTLQFQTTRYHNMVIRKSSLLGPTRTGLSTVKLDKFSLENFNVAIISSLFYYNLLKQNICDEILANTVSTLAVLLKKRVYN